MAASLILDRYRILDTLGKGGSGTVDLCWDTRMQRRVAIKRIPLADADAGQPVPGLAEARMGAMLNHPSIVSVHDFEACGEEAFLIMEAIEGPSLRRLIDDTPAGCFDIDIATSVSTAVANALSFAHDNQVLHLDIKPDNILTTLSGTAKVSDFGIAQLGDGGGYGTARGGTIGYMPPEQMDGEQLDERCDVFAFAVVVYEMLTGTNPYRAKTLNAARKALKRSVEPVSAIRNDVDPAIDDVLLCALSPEREQRPSSVRAFFSELLYCLGSAEAGIDKLAQVVAGPSQPDDDSPAPGARTQATPLLERIGPRARLVGGRALCALLCWWVAFVGMNAFTALGVPVAAGLALLAAVASLAKPAFGTLIALAMLAAGLLAHPTDGMLLSAPILGIIVVLAAVIWLAALGRERLLAMRTALDANCLLATAPLGLAWLTPLAVMATGLTLPPRRALATSVAASLLAVVLAAATGTGSLLHFEPTIAASLPVADVLAVLAAPGTWVVVASWILATVSLSLCGLRATRVSSVLGVIAAACLLIAGNVLAGWAATGAWGMPGTAWMLAIGASAALMFIAVALGAPRRLEKEA